ncbi:hypothetical protein VKT23_013045 [Stygiomarasmius scandens]|uniref:Uncharacterized protein n=1 Tax=Marasmiellus scandens TaxID=2682957 RepID=A0ABR1J9R7_9AGAR
MSVDSPPAPNDATGDTQSMQNPSNRDNTPSSSVKGTGVLSLHDDHPDAPSPAVAPNLPESSSVTTGPRRSLRHSASSAALADQEFDELIDSLNPDHDKASSTRAKSTKSASTRSPKKKPVDKAPANSLTVLDHRITDVEAHQRVQDKRLSVTARELHERVDELSGSDFHATVLQLEELHTSVSLMRDSYDHNISELQTAATLTTQTMAALKTTNNDLVHEVRRLSQDATTTSNNLSQVSGDVAELKRRLREVESERSLLRNHVDSLSTQISASQNRDDMMAPGAKRQRTDPAPVSSSFYNQTVSSPVLSLSAPLPSALSTLPPAPVMTTVASHTLPPAPMQNGATHSGVNHRGRRWGVIVGPMSFDDVDFGQPRPLLPVAVNIIRMVGERINTSTVVASRHDTNYLLITWPYRNQADFFMSSWKAKQPLAHPYNYMTATKDF